MGFLWRSPVVRRLLFSLVAGFGLAWAISEGSFLLLRDSSYHEPHRIELVVPPGTAARVAAGETPPAIPPDLSFVVGDVLAIKNEDSVMHQLGPMLVPPGTTATLEMRLASKFRYSCSWQPGRYLGLDVRPRVTAATRLQALLLAGPPMVALIALYSLVLVPLRPRSDRRPGLAEPPTAGH
jgi:hypothetical protein